MSLPAGDMDELELEFQLKNTTDKIPTEEYNGQSSN
jgi:hypothetical protein